MKNKLKYDDSGLELTTSKNQKVDIKQISQIWIYTSEDLKEGKRVRYYTTDSRFADIKIDKYEIHFEDGKLGKIIKVKLREQEIYGATFN